MFCIIVCVFVFAILKIHIADGSHLLAGYRIWSPDGSQREPPSLVVMRKINVFIFFFALTVRLFFFLWCEPVYRCCFYILLMLEARVAGK